MEKVKYQNILFDLDGTLTDPYEGITGGIKYAAREMGYPIKDESRLREAIGPSLAFAFGELIGMKEEEITEAIRQYRVYYSRQGALENEIYPGIRELLAELHAQGRHVILSSSKPEEFCTQILAHFDILKYFHFVGGNNFKEERPSKEAVIRHVMANCPDVTAENTLMVGDRCYDVTGSAKCGIACAGVLYGFGTREELEEAGAKYIVKTVDELRELII